MAKRNQAKERRWASVRDQHGREWESTWDLVGLGYCAPFEPRGWTAPILPPQACIREDLNRPGGILINYEKWIAEWQSAINDWERSRREWAQRMHSTPTDPDVLQMVGPEPLPLDVIRAAKAGNKWALGLVPLDRIPPWAEKYRGLFIHRPEMPAQVFADVEFPDIDGPVVPEARVEASPKAAPHKGGWPKGRPRKAVTLEAVEAAAGV